jgi:hypothetical protein
MSIPTQPVRLPVVRRKFNMPKFILLLHEEKNAFQSMGPEDMQKIIEKYKAWSERMRAQGHLRGGEKLEDGTGRVLRRNGEKTSVTDGPYAESREVVAGYFVLEADNYDKAVELSRDCPHIDFGTIEIRQFDVV